MALSLIESAKLAADGGETKRAAVIEMFARSSAWLNSLVFNDIPGNAYAYNREGVLPGIAFRGTNEAYAESTGIINPFVEALRICGGDLDSDLALEKMFGAGIRAKHETMKIKALAAEVTRVLVKGDSIAQPREFDGLQARLAGLQVVSNAAGAGGAALSLANLDLAIDRTASPTAIWLNHGVKRLFTAALRTVAVSGQIIAAGVDAFGKPVLTYAGLPLLPPYPANDGTEVIDNVEVATGGGATTTALYVVGVGDGLLTGLQNGTMQVRDLGEIDVAPVHRTRVEWLVGLCLEHGRAATRVRDINPALAIVP